MPQVVFDLETYRRRDVTEEERLRAQALNEVEKAIVCLKAWQLQNTGGVPVLVN